MLLLLSDDVQKSLKISLPKEVEGIWIRGFESHP